MFTVKIYYETGHSMFECTSYHFRRGTFKDGFLETIDRLECLDKDRGIDNVVSIGADEVYVMNGNGKTVDSFQRYADDDIRRWAVDPDAARRQAKIGNALAITYLGKIGSGEPLPA